MVSKKGKKAENSQVQTKTKTLSALEEKVIRMRHGLRAPDDLPLEQIGQDDPKIAKELRAIEERALQAVGARKSPQKRKIVSALRRKSN